MDKKYNTKAHPTFSKIKLVVGCDIGDGDSGAYARIVADQGGKLLPLYAHKSRDQQIEKSAVAKTDSGVITIGEDAAKQQEFIINFKRSPKSWNNKSSLNVEYKPYLLCTTV